MSASKAEIIVDQQITVRVMQAQAKPQSVAIAVVKSTAATKAAPIEPDDRRREAAAAREDIRRRYETSFQFRGWDDSGLND